MRCLESYQCRWSPVERTDSVALAGIADFRSLLAVAANNSAAARSPFAGRSLAAVAHNLMCGQWCLIRDLMTLPCASLTWLVLLAVVFTVEHFGGVLTLLVRWVR